MKNQDIPVIGKELSIFSCKPDTYTKVGVIKLTKKDIKSEDGFVKALQNVMNNFDNGMYSVNHNSSIFARFNIENEQVKLHRRSENTGMLMPCYNYFEE